jgi:hypothetical protein
MAKEVLDFVNSLKERNGGAKKPLRSLVHITEEDIAEVRREMWVISHVT